MPADLLSLSFLQFRNEPIGFVAFTDMICHRQLWNHNHSLELYHTDPTEVPFRSVDRTCRVKLCTACYYNPHNPIFTVQTV